MAHKFAVTRGSAALEAVRRTLGVFELTTNCTSKPGYLVRFLGETDDPVFKRYYTGDPAAHRSSVVGASRRGRRSEGPRARSP